MSETTANTDPPKSETTANTDPPKSETTANTDPPKSETTANTDPHNSESSHSDYNNVELHDANGMHSTKAEKGINAKLATFHERLHAA
jgi:hypothetical protein